MYGDLRIELLKKAKDLPNKFTTNGETVHLLMRAADAIEDLSKKVVTLQEEMSAEAESHLRQLEILQRKEFCPTCERCSDNCVENITRCPIEKCYALPKDGYCHLYKHKKP